MTKQGSNPRRKSIYLIPDFFEDPDIDTKHELIVMLYLLVGSDILGVCPWRMDRVVSGVRMTTDKSGRTTCWETLQSLEKKHKCRCYPIKIDARGRMEVGYVWNFSYFYFRSFYGKSPDLIRHAGKMLRKAQAVENFGDQFVSDFLELYETRYSLIIPVEGIKDVI